MNSRYRKTARLLAPITAVFVAASAFSQDTELKDLVPEPEDPAVLAVLETEPSTLAQQARAAALLADLDRPDLARGFLKQIIAARPDQQQLAALAEQFDSSMFTAMASRKNLLPEAKILADAVLEAVNKQLQDPNRISGLIDQLGDQSPEKQQEAFAGLQDARGAAIGSLIEVLADPRQAAQHPHAREALVRMGPRAVDPLLGILERSDPRLMVQAILVLGEMRARKAAVYLLGPFTAEASDPKVRAAAGAALARLLGRVPSRQEAIRLLTERAKDYFDRRQPVDGAHDGKVEIWSWHEGQRKCVDEQVSAGDAARILAARFARDAYAIDTKDRRSRLLYLTTMLEAAVYAAGLDKPLEEGDGTALAEATAFEVGAIEEVLDYAMATDHPAAATAAAEILGRRGAADELLHHGAQIAPLVRATRHGDRRLRMAALEAIVRLQPVRPFPGSSYILPSLEFFAASGGKPRALVGGPIMAVSQTLGGMLASCGYEVDTALTGREIVRMAMASPDYELVLIDAAIDRPTIDILLQQLRHDYRSADLRVGLIARSGHLERARRVAARDPMAMAFSRPHYLEDIKWQLKQMESLSPRLFVAHAQRQQQAGAALDRLAELSESPGRLYDLRRAQHSIMKALYVPELSKKTVAVLGNLATPESQRALVELASRWSQPLEARGAAVAALRRNILENGVLLTTTDIVRQYERYNQSRDLDAKSQQILGLILDCIEMPTEIVKATGG